MRNKINFMGEEIKEATSKNRPMDFSKALDLIKTGYKVGRIEWKNARYVFLVDGSKFQVNRPPLNKMFSEGTEITYRAHVE